MIVMGIDQSLTSTGLVILTEIGDNAEVLHYEQIATSKTDNPDNFKDTIIRARKIAERIQFRAMEYNVDKIVMEGLSLGSIGNATRNLAVLAGVIVSHLGTFDLPDLVPPNSLKKFATGNGRAGKPDMVASISTSNPLLWEHLTGTTIKAGKYDIADAYWLALYPLRKEH